MSDKERAHYIIDQMTPEQIKAFIALFECHDYRTFKQPEENNKTSSAECQEKHPAELTDEQYQELKRRIMNRFPEDGTYPLAAVIREGAINAAIVTFEEYGKLIKEISEGQTLN